MSNPFKKQNSQQPKTSLLLDRVIRQNTQIPGVQLPSIPPINSNNGQNVNNGILQKKEEKKESPKEKSENVNIQQNSSFIKPSFQDMKKQSPSPFSNPFQVHHPLMTDQNKIPPLQQQLLQVKIVAKNGVALGSFTLDRSIILQKKDIKLNEIKIEEGYKKQLRKMWDMIKDGKRILDVFILTTNLAIMTNSQKNPHSPMPDNLIRRLKQGMEFYQYQPQRESTMAKLLQQNIETNSNVALCQQIQKVSNKCKTDKFIGLYCILQNPRYLETGVDLPSFLMQDKIYLIRLYQSLSRTSRLSSRKLINLEEQLYILRQVVNYFSKTYIANEKNSNIDPIIELGRQIIRLFYIILIDNSSEVAEGQIQNYFIHMLHNLKVIGMKNSTIKSFLNNFQFHLLLKWGNHLQHIQMGCIQTFVQYYSNEKQMEAKQLALTMITLSQITAYDEKMCEMIEKKQRRFVQANKQMLQKRINKSHMISIGIQCILLIKQSNKTNKKLYVQELMKLMYRVCPVSIMGFNSDNYTNLELVLPFISRYYKKSANTQTQYVTTTQINEFLPEPYKFESSSDNFIIAKYIMSVVKHIEGNQFNNLIESKHKLSEIEQALKQFNVSTLMINTQLNPLSLVRLLCKYVTNYTEEYYYLGDSVRKQEKKDTKSKRIEQIRKLIDMIYQTMDAIIQYSFKQHEHNKNTNTQKYIIAYQNILLNLSPLANLIGCSGLLPNSDKKVIVQASTNAVIGINSADIPQNYRKVMQKLYKSYTTQQTTPNIGQRLKIISQHMNNSIKICTEWQQKIKQKQKINNYLVYLLTVEYMYKISKDTQLQPNLLFMYKYITYQHILQYVIQICIKNKNFSSDLWYLISTALLLLPKMFFAHQYNNTSLDPNLVYLLINNKEVIITLCLNRISANQYTPNQLCEKISYLELIRSLLRISNEETLMTNSRKSYAESRSKQDKHISETMPSAWAKEIINKTISIKRQNNQNILADKILVLIAEIGFNYDNRTYEIIVQEDYIDEIISSIFSLLTYYLNKVPSKIKNYLSDHESQQDICAWNIRCLNLFENMFNYPPGIPITIDKAHTLAQTCLKIIKSKTLKIKANGREIINWIEILLPMIHKNIKSVKIYEVLLEESILFICEQKDRQQQRNQKKKEKRQHFKLVQLIMVYMSNEHRISQLFQKKDLLEKVLRSLMVILDKVFTLFMTQNTTYFKMSQLQTWYKTAVISLVKISQFINIYHLILTQKNQKMSDNLLAACIKMKLVLEQSLKSHPLRDMSLPKQQNIKQMILCSFQILSFSNQEKQPQTKIYFNQALINVSMENKQSFQSFFLHLASQAIETRAIYREKHEQKTRQNKNYLQQVDSNKYRPYYLFYYFINKILTSRDQNPRIYFMFNTQTNKIDQQIHESLKRLLDHMIQPIHIEDINQNLWFLVLVHRVVKLDPSILQKKSVLCDILQFCCRTIERLLLTKQNKNPRRSNRHYERFSLLEQNKQMIYFQDWLVFVQVIGIACLVLRTCAHSSLKEQQNCLSLIRNFVFKKIKAILMTWDNFQQNNNKKLIFFPISSRLNTNSQTKQTFVKYVNQNLKEKQKQKKSDSKQLVEQQQVTVQNYIKSTMMLSSVALIMNLIKHDILFLFGSQRDVKQKFMEFTQQVLGSFRIFYDTYFQNGQISHKNQQIISTNLDQYIKDPISTKNNCYLNKILRQYWLIPVEASGTQKLLKKQISRIIDQKNEELSAILWYNNIEDILTSLGYKPSNKFVTKSAISNSTMRLNSRNGSSMRLI